MLSGTASPRSTARERSITRPYWSPTTSCDSSAIGACTCSGSRSEVVRRPDQHDEVRLRDPFHGAPCKEAHDERGMNPLFLCLGALRWPLKDRSGALASAPLILSR
ncbi:DUF4011 domain-containing protein [Microbacterium aurantiacum]|uniref:DUF4011 domain-containing protein n=1 Tax=Microbacterium aurantiacum TaxID=162393 RepID=UPI003AACDAB8